MKPRVTGLCAGLKMPDIMLRALLETSGTALGINPRGKLRDTGAGWSARLADKDDNSFDAIRLALAALVVFEHSYFLRENRYDSEPLYLLTGGQVNSGSLAVFMFFAISGFLVTRSYLLTGNVQRYLAKRIARIVPGFLVATFVGCVVLGPMAAKDLGTFFAGQKWVSLVVQALALRQVGVTGILDGNPVQLIHGTLWTIRYEFDCYLGIALFGSLGLLVPGRAWAVYLLAMAGLAAAWAGLVQLPTIDHGFFALLISSPDQWPLLFPFFLAGSAFYVYRDHVPKWLPICLLAGILLATMAVVGGMYWALLLGGTYVVIYLALSSSVEMKLFSRRVDLSYGVYLYGWPVGQMLFFFTHQSLGRLPLFVLTMALTLCAAYGSWRLVEYPSLRLVKGRKV
jgi:peptidoglycan/LPS O-acetylase OafA/YrhL